MQKLYSLKNIETTRLNIRPVRIGDEIQVNEAIKNSISVLQAWMPWANDPSLETTRNFIRKAVLARNSWAVTDFPMVVIHKEDKKIIGCSGYNDRSNFYQGLYEIGYWCDVDYQAKGYVTEYVNALTRYTISELEANAVVLKIEIDNVRSIAVARRLGFINQGKEPSSKKEGCLDYCYTCKKLEDLPPLTVSWN